MSNPDKKEEIEQELKEEDENRKVSGSRAKDESGNRRRENFATLHDEDFEPRPLPDSVNVTESNSPPPQT
jgi:hypothetical protein